MSGPVTYGMGRNDDFVGSPCAYGLGRSLLAQTYRKVYAYVLKVTRIARRELRK